MDLSWADKLRTLSSGRRREDSGALGYRYISLLDSEFFRLRLGSGRYRSRFCIRRPTNEGAERG